MNYIQLYSKVNFSGDSVRITKDTPDLASDPNNFSKLAMSLTVSGDPWVVYTENNAKGDYRLFKEGDYDTLHLFSNNISSLRKVKGGLSDPDIVLYDAINHGGNPLTLTAETPTLSAYGWEKKPASLKVTKGAWQLFAADNCDPEADNVAVLSGDDLANLQTIGWFHKICSLKPYA